MAMREIAVGDVPVRALRVTFVGELGWELYCPTEYGAGLWRALWEAGREHGMVAGGYSAIDSLRLEKGYRVWAADITPDDTPHEAGLGFCVKLDKRGGFIGDDALRARARRRPPRAGCCLRHARGPALGRAGQRAGARRRRGRRPRDDRGLRLHASSARSPTPTCRPSTPTPGTAVEVDVFGRWVAGEVVARAAVRPGRRARAVVIAVIVGRCVQGSPQPSSPRS